MKTIFTEITFLTKEKQNENATNTKRELVFTRFDNFSLTYLLEDKIFWDNDFFKFEKIGCKSLEFHTIDTVVEMEIF